MQNNKSSRLLRLSIAALLFALLLVPTAVLAQSDFSLNINKIIGYGVGNQIAGTFNISVVGPEDQISSVNFMIDGQSMGEVAQAPFRVRFETSKYSTGPHAFTAAVTLKNGTIVEVGPSNYVIPTAEQQRSGVTKILFPILGIVVVALLISTGVQFLTSRRKGGSAEPGTARNYGMLGGAICPKCHHPTPRHPYGLNMITGKLDRCENCGKWSIMRAAPIDVLRAAEQAERDELKSAAAVPEKSEEEKLREMLDRSKYTDQS